MTVAALITLLQQVTGNRTTGAYTSTWYTDRLNEGYRRLAVMRHKDERGYERRVRFPQFFDRLKDRVLLASATDNFVANQANVMVTLALYDRTNNRPVEPETAYSLMSRDRTEPGDIVEWAPYAQNNVSGYLVWRKPSVNTTVDEFVYRFPETLASGGSDPVIDEEFHELIAYAVAPRVARLQGNRDMADDLEKQFLNAVATTRLPGEEALLAGPRWYEVGV